MNDQIIGIDPGLEGGIAILNNGQIRFEPIPRDKIDKKEVDCIKLYSLFKEAFDSSSKTAVFIEYQHAFPGQGTISTARIVSEYKTIYTAAKIASGLSQNIAGIFPVSPITWQRHIYDAAEIKDRTAGKLRSINAFKRLISEQIPQIGKKKLRPHLGLIEAGLIAKYGEIIIKT